jgi:hypothetical protein
MAHIDAFVPAPARVRPARPQVDLTWEAIRRGVQYLAFRLDAVGLEAIYAPGPGPVNGLVARAARAAVAAHADLASAPDGPRREDALALGRRFARQLAAVKGGVTRAPTMALRSAYLDALAEVMIEAVRRDGPAALEAWVAASDTPTGRP